jgi:alkanesulfonate monooxygenase SsuD/methylene tetrahydromethanopterin reductase-like flavin-dependent oxidoreductase (luciferase family)
LYRGTRLDDPPRNGGHDPFFPLLIAAEHTTRVRLATGVAIAFPRAPMVVAQMAWDLQRLSAGRFTLGLGTQVKGHNERRYGVPWPGAPGPRMREYVACLRAIFVRFQRPDAPRWFEASTIGRCCRRYARADRAHPQIPIHIAVANVHVASGGESCDGVCIPSVRRNTSERMCRSSRGGAGG